MTDTTAAADNNVTNSVISADTSTASNECAALWLVRIGVALVLVALLTGLAAPALANPRMGLSSHLAGLSGGILLIALGAAWRFVRLGQRGQAAAVVLLAYGNIANWLATFLAALWNAGAMMPIAAPTPSAAAWQEAVVQACLISLTPAMLVGVGLVLWGVRRN